MIRVSVSGADKLKDAFFGPFMLLVWQEYFLPKVLQLEQEYGDIIVVIDTVDPAEARG